MRVLVIKPSSLGDLLHTFPSVALIRREVPEVEGIDWVVNDNLAGVVSLCPGVDRIIRFPRHTPFSMTAWRRFYAELHECPYDIVIDYQGLFRSGFIAFLTRDAVVWGFANAREGAPLFYDVKHRLTSLTHHALLKNLELTRAVFSLKSEGVPAPALNIPADAVRSLHEKLPETAAGLPMVSVCFASRWASKNWPLPFIADSLLQLRERLGTFTCVLTGMPENEADGARLEALLEPLAPVNLTGRTSLPELAALLSESSVMLTVDSGPMHLAAAAGTPCVALFGSTTPGLTGPFGPDGFHAIIQSQCDRSPCMQRVCPLQRECSAGCEPQRVAEALHQRIQRSRREK